MRLLALLFLVLLAMPAGATMAPEVYEAARRDAPDVVLLAIAGVEPPPVGRQWGQCTVVGTVLAVERGDRHRIGDPVALAVPCAATEADYPDGGALYQPLTSLLASTYGRAFLGADGQVVLSQYEQLTDADLPR